MISFILDIPETSWFNKQYYRMIQISFETREKITTEKREYKREARDIARTEIFLKTMVVRTARTILRTFYIKKCYKNSKKKIK